MKLCYVAKIKHNQHYIIYYKNPQSNDNPKIAIHWKDISFSDRSTGLNKHPIIELTSHNMSE